MVLSVRWEKDSEGTWVPIPVCPVGNWIKFSEMKPAADGRYLCFDGEYIYVMDWDHGEFFDPYITEDKSECDSPDYWAEINLPEDCVKGKIVTVT